MSDEGFHEIQLNGKQLVFLFMASVVVTVVIFLLGVMFGRGVRQPAADAVTATAAAPEDPTAPIQAAPSATTSNSDRVPITAQETLTYAERLEAPTPVNETLKDPTADPTKVVPPPVVKEPVKEAATETVTEPAKQPVKEPAKEPVKEPASAPQPPPVDSARFSEPSGGGWVVQVMATKTREEAEGVARRLNSKGYPTFISLRETAAPEKFGVRVGKYNEKRDAEAVSNRLTKEEHFKPWLTH